MQLGLIPLLPFLGFLTLLLLGSRLSRRLTSVVGVGSLLLSCVAAAVIGFSRISPKGFFTPQNDVLWTWIPFYAPSFDGTTIQFAFYLDSLSMVMTGVITLVATLIALFSVQFMEEDSGLVRFFASMDLFVASMLVLVLADNFLLLFLGWEGVGLCSYLLIGFWYENKLAGQASMKAFITTRIGDVCMLFAFFIIFHQLGTLNIQEALLVAKETWPYASLFVTLTAFCLLLGAVGKSAQIPLQTWLPDAMLGPTPVSALIHAATMVTAGVYLIARTGPLFDMAPMAQMAVLGIGAATLIVAGVAAVVQTDLKKVLAYSTMSQIGYMFLALGAGAYGAAMFHFMTHAFFKALLFLSAGVVGYSMHHEYSLAKLGGLRNKLPLAFGSFLVGACCLSALPFVTSGFYSKELILNETYHSVLGGAWPFWVGAFGALLTGFYIFRAFFLVFFGHTKGHVGHVPGWLMKLPLTVLGIFSLGIGFVQIPEWMGDIELFEDFVSTSLPALPVSSSVGFSEGLLFALATLPGLLGIALAYARYGRTTSMVTVGQNPSLLTRFFLSGWGFDWLYQTFLIRPYGWLARILEIEVVQVLYTGFVGGLFWIHRILSKTQTGVLKNYLFATAVALLVLVFVMVFS